MLKLGMIAMFSLVAGGCVTDGQDGVDGDDGAEGTDGAAGPAGPRGEDGVAAPDEPLPGVYTLANPAGPNTVASYLRAATGNLSRQGRWTTGGAGSGGGLGSQGAIAYSASTKRFFTVNAGDNTVSMLALDKTGAATSLSTVASGGVRPVSVTVRGDLVYVAHQGTLGVAAVNASISGFRIVGDALVPIAGSIQALSGSGDVRPTDIELSPDGKFVLVVERFASRLSVFPLENGAARAGTFHASAGMQPFAFDFSPEGTLIVAEVGDGTATGSSVSSYALSASGQLTPITSALATHQGAACWIVVAGGFAYIANAATANITGIAVSETGELALRDASGVTAVTGSGATDLAVTPDRGTLYSLAGSPRALHIFTISADGGLTAMPALAGVPATAVGLVAR